VPGSLQEWEAAKLVCLTRLQPQQRASRRIHSRSSPSFLSDYRARRKANTSRAIWPQQSPCFDKIEPLSGETRRKQQRAERRQSTQGPATQTAARYGDAADAKRLFSRRSLKDHPAPAKKR